MTGSRSACSAGVVGRLDAFDADERPERWPDLEQLVGEDAVVAGALALAPGALEQFAQLALDRLQFARKTAAVAVFLEGLSQPQRDGPGTCCRRSREAPR